MSEIRVEGMLMNMNKINWECFDLLLTIIKSVNIYVLHSHRMEWPIQKTCSNSENSSLFFLLPFFLYILNKNQNMVSQAESWSTLCLVTFINHFCIGNRTSATTVPLTSRRNITILAESVMSQFLPELWKFVVNLPACKFLLRSTYKLNVFYLECLDSM